MLRILVITLAVNEIELEKFYVDYEFFSYSSLNTFVLKRLNQQIYEYETQRLKSKSYLS